MLGQVVRQHTMDFACMDFLTVVTKNLRDDLVRKYKPW